MHFSTFTVVASGSIVVSNVDRHVLCSYTVKDQILSNIKNGASVGDEARINGIAPFLVRQWKQWELKKAIRRQSGMF